MTLESEIEMDHTNLCLAGRSYGMFGLKRQGACRDCTTLFRHGFSAGLVILTLDT